MEHDHKGRGGQAEIPCVPGMGPSPWADLVSSSGIMTATEAGVVFHQGYLLRVLTSHSLAIWLCCPPCRRKKQ